MARLLYGGTPADFAVALGSSVQIPDVIPEATGRTALIPEGAVVFNVYDSVDGNQVTDLLDESGSPISTVSTSVELGDLGRVPAFYGPDNYTADLWLTTDGTVYYRIPPSTTDLFVRLAAAEENLAQLLNSQPLIVHKTAEPTNNTANLVDDPELVLTIPQSGSWSFFGPIFFSSSATADFKLTFVGAAGLNSNSIRFSVNANAGSNSAQMYFGGQVANIDRVNTFQAVHVWGNLDGPAAGRLVLQWGQQAVDAGPTAVLKGSWLQARRLP
ncbi:MAG TPA: hypothetical protein VF174_09855 [Micromonosporaceae bacterium]